MHLAAGGGGRARWIVNTAAGFCAQWTVNVHCNTQLVVVVDVPAGP